jgi:hypothetical protein
MDIIQGYLDELSSVKESGDIEANRKKNKKAERKRIIAKRNKYLGVTKGVFDLKTAAKYYKDKLGKK